MSGCVCFVGGLLESAEIGRVNEMLATEFTSLVGCRHPIQQAVMGGISGMHLAAAVANAGGVGMMHHLGPVELSERLDWMDENVDGFWGVGFRADTIEQSMERSEIVVDRAPIVEFCWADPSTDLVDTIHGGGALAFWQLGSVESARMAADAGVDVVVAQGSEAGGHLAGKTPLYPLLEGVLDAVDLPVVAAGGIASGRQVAAVLAAGASAARAGTLFVASVESDASDVYRQALVDADEGEVILTTAFGAEWPDAPHRVLERCLKAAEAISDDPVGIYNDGTEILDIPRFSTRAPTKYSSGPHEAMAMYAGMGVGSVRTIESAANTVQRLMDEAERLLTEVPAPT